MVHDRGCTYIYIYIQTLTQYQTAVNNCQLPHYVWQITGAYTHAYMKLFLLPIHYTLRAEIKNDYLSIHTHHTDNMQ